jgi:hypothetical protein
MVDEDVETTKLQYICFDTLERTCSVVSSGAQCNRAQSVTTQQIE